MLVLLLIQIAAAVTVFRPDTVAVNQAEDQPLLARSEAVSAVDQILVADEQGKQIKLLRGGKHWVLPELDGLPADGKKVQALLGALGEHNHGWPVAHTAAARQRFQVADYLYQRQITLLTQGEVRAKIFLGTSPTYRKVHARNEQHDAIYSISLNTFDVPAQSDAWLDSALLQTRTPVQITADGYSLDRSGGQWRLGTGEEPDSRELEALLGALRSLQVAGIAGKGTQQELAQTEAELILRISSLAGEVTLQLFKLGEEYFVLSSEYSRLFQLSAYDFDRLTGIDAFLLSGDNAVSP